VPGKDGLRGIPERKRRGEASNRAPYVRPTVASRVGKKQRRGQYAGYLGEKLWYRETNLATGLT